MVRLELEQNLTLVSHDLAGELNLAVGSEIFAEPLQVIEVLWSFVVVRKNLWFVAGWLVHRQPVF